jgi:hypothetical protein
MHQLKGKILDIMRQEDINNIEQAAPESNEEAKEQIAS